MGEEVRPRGDKYLTRATPRGKVASSLSLLQGRLESLPPHPSDQSCFLPGGPQAHASPLSLCPKGPGGRALTQFPQPAPGPEVLGGTFE